MIRLLQDSASNGVINMARDEALLTLVGSGTAPPTLRLYEWSEPTISLGYFQPFAQYETLEPPADTRSVVRRLTGGGAILHDRELTYSLTLPTSHPLVGNKPRRLYEVVHQALIHCLANLGVAAAFSDASDDSGAGKGPFFCFARRHEFDVLLGADKLAGSAQRRTRTAILQHGSIVVERRFACQPSASLTDFGVDATSLRQRLPEALGWAISVPIEPGNWTPAERQQAQELESKFASDDWTRRF